MFTEKRVIDTERMMEMLEVSTLSVKNMSGMEIKNFEKKHGKFEITEYKYVSFLRVAGFVMASVVFTEENIDNVHYMDITSITIDNLTPSKFRLIKRVLEEVEIFSMKKGIRLVSINGIVIKHLELHRLGFLPVKAGEVSYTTEYKNYFDFLIEYNRYSGKFKRNFKAKYVEGMFNTNMMNFLYSKGGKYDVNVMAVSHNSPFEKWEEQFKTFEPIFLEKYGIRFSKTLVRPPEQIVSEMVSNKNTMERKSEDLLDNSAHLITMLSPTIYDIRGKDEEDVYEILGDFSDFGKICRGGVEESFVNTSLEIGDYVLTYETGGTILSFGVLKHKDEDENVKLLVLCARPSSGLGSRLLKEIENFSLKIGAKNVKLDAVSNKIGWYRLQGYDDDDRHSSLGVPMIKSLSCVS